MTMAEPSLTKAEITLSVLMPPTRVMQPSVPSSRQFRISAFLFKVKAVLDKKKSKISHSVYGDFEILL